MAAKNALYDAHILDAAVISGARVISVVNVNVGGTGRTPALVVVGSTDSRTPGREAEQDYTAVQVGGIPTALGKVPGENHHGLAGRPSQSAAKASAILAWFERYRSPQSMAISAAP